MNDLRTLLIIGGPVLWAILAYLAVFFAVGLCGLAGDVMALVRGSAQ